MSRTGSLVTKKFASVVLDVVGASRFRSTYGRLPRNAPSLSADYCMNPGLRMFSINSNTTNTDAHR